MIRAEGLGVEFRRLGRRPVKALDGLDLHVREGDFFALLGQNGAGKSTALHTFLGLLKPTSGRVALFGRPPAPGASGYGALGYLPEEPHYHDYLTVDEAVDYYADLAGGAAGKRSGRELLERLQLAEFGKRRVSACSKGMKQKLGIV